MVKLLPFVDQRNLGAQLYGAGSSPSHTELDMPLPLLSLNFPT